MNPESFPEYSDSIEYPSHGGLVEEGPYGIFTTEQQQLFMQAL